MRYPALQPWIPGSSPGIQGGVGGWRSAFCFMRLSAFHYLCGSALASASQRSTVAHYPALAERLITRKEITHLVEEVGGAVADVAAGALEPVAGFLGAFIDLLAGFVGALFDLVAGILGAVLDVVDDRFGLFLHGVADILGALFDGAAGLLGALLDRLAGRVEMIADRGAGIRAAGRRAVGCRIVGAGGRGGDEKGHHRGGRDCENIRTSHGAYSFVEPR